MKFEDGEVVTYTCSNPSKDDIFVKKEGAMLLVCPQLPGTSGFQFVPPPSCARKTIKAIYFNAATIMYVDLPKPCVH